MHFLKDGKVKEFDQIDWQKKWQCNNDKLKQIFKSISDGEHLEGEYDHKNYIRIFFSQGVGQRNFLRNLSDAFTGGIYCGNPKFGEYEVLGGGIAKNSKGNKLLFIDVYPMERIEFMDWEDDLSQSEILEATINDERLMNQLQNYGVKEVQTSGGTAVNLETKRPRVKIHQTLPV